MWTIKTAFNVEMNRDPNAKKGKEDIHTQYYRLSQLHIPSLPSIKTISWDFGQWSVSISVKAHLTDVLLNAPVLTKNDKGRQKTYTMYVQTM